MAGGNAFCHATISVGSVLITDITEWTVALGATLLSNRSDGLKYPQLGCSVDHTAEIGYKSYNLAQISQSSSSAPFVGSVVDNGVVLTADNINGSSVVFTISPARPNHANSGGGHGRLADMDVAYEAVGKNGIEPTVSWGIAG